MFSGIIPSIGTVTAHSRNRLGIQLDPAIKSKLGDSIAVNGVCLTVARQIKLASKTTCFFDLSEETLAKTTLGSYLPGRMVNVEPALTMKDALGGHIVQGHVDGRGRVQTLLTQRNGRVIEFETPKDVLNSMVIKGSVTVDGVSLTASAVSTKTFSVALIPFTLQHTTLGSLKKGDLVNLEADIIGKYVAKYLKKK